MAHLDAAEFLYRHTPDLIVNQKAQSVNTEIPILLACPFLQLFENASEKLWGDGHLQILCPVDEIR